MQFRRFGQRAGLLALSLLSACAASDPSGAATQSRLGRMALDTEQAGGASAFLTGRFAAQEGDSARAAEELLRALASDPTNAEIRQQAFIACVLANRPEALHLARQMPGDQIAVLLLGNYDAKAGNWEAAEQRFALLDRQGPAKILQPLLVAWAQLGEKRAEAALATLKPYAAEGARYRAINAFHAALIADLAGRPGDAAKNYRIAQAEYATLNLDLARALASWQARQGHADEARQTLESFGKEGPEFGIALPRLEATAAERQIRRPADGMAAAYVALAVAMRQQDSNDYAGLLLRMALDLRPDLTAARLMLSELGEQAKRPEEALSVLAPVPESDPLAAVVDLRRASLQDRLDHPDEALRIAAAVAAANPSRSEPWSLEAAVLRTQHRYAEAVPAYDKAIDLLPKPLHSSDWPLFYERGIALERSHDWPRAEADFQHALQLSPDQPLVLNYLAYSWTEMGHELQKARQMLVKAAEVRPNDGAILDSLGWVTLRQGDVPGAVKWLEKAVELESQDPTINGHLGDAYWASGRKLEATYQWQRALNMKPEPDDLPKLQKKLTDARQALGIPEPAAQAAQ